MLCQINGEWLTGTLKHPFGSGINFQIEVEDLDPILMALEVARSFERLSKAGIALVLMRRAARESFLCRILTDILCAFPRTLANAPLADLNTNDP